MLFDLVPHPGFEVKHQPGQFLEVSLFGVGEAPISISSPPTRPQTIQLCVRNVGQVTSKLHGLEPGSTIGIRGPFGHGFDTEELKGRDILFVAGGLGLAPLRSLFLYVLDKRDDYGVVTLLYGAKNPGELLYRNEIAAWQERDDIQVLVTVDRPDAAWRGHAGVITTLFKHVEVDPKRTYAVIVGPPVMYKFAILEAQAMGLADDRIIVSLERRMKCGVGKCGHCQINNLYVCQDGPVFKYSLIKNLREAI
jgi:sulfhydrogenase subunit gamma (sulfur reductase)